MNYRKEDRVKIRYSMVYICLRHALTYRSYHLIDSALPDNVYIRDHDVLYGKVNHLLNLRSSHHRSGG